MAGSMDVMAEFCEHTKEEISHSSPFDPNQRGGLCMAGVQVVLSKMPAKKHEFIV
jgi:hypothetical protein